MGSLGYISEPGGGGGRVEYRAAADVYAYVVVLAEIESGKEPTCPPPRAA